MNKRLLEEFMRRFFRARTEQIQQELRDRAAFRNRFFAPDCYWDSRSGAVERSESEVILEVCVENDKLRVITQEVLGYFPQRLRYTLIPSNDSWLIQDVQAFFEGEGWMGEKEMKSRLKTLQAGANRGTPPWENRPD